MELTQENLKDVMRFRPNLKDLAPLFGVSEDTIIRRIKDWSACSFSDFKEQHSFEIKKKLMDKAIEQALSGNTTMLIFCLKNYCGWQDKPAEATNDRNMTITLNYDRNKRPPADAK